MANKLFKIREKINLYIFDSKANILKILSFITVIITVFVMAGTIRYYGFPETEATYKYNYLIIRISLVYFLIRYLILLFYDFHPLEFIKRRWFEGIILFLFFFDALFPRAFESVFIISSIKEIIKSHTLLIFQFYFLIIVLLEISHTASRLARLKIGPAALLTLSFVTLIFSGAGLLMLPEMTTGHHFRFLDAVFTATSACT